jgi:hypothetical protein
MEFTHWSICMKPYIRFGILLLLVILPAACAPVKTSPPTINPTIASTNPTITPEQAATQTSTTTSILHEDLSQKCPVTLPNGSLPPGEQQGKGILGNNKLWTGLWPGGVVLARPDFVRPNGEVHMKWWWWRAVPGQPLTLTGHRLDGRVPDMRAEIPDGYDSNFQATGLIFPTEGCWEVTGTAGDDSLTFVTLVVKVPTDVSDTCNITFPNGDTPPGEQPSNGFHGNGQIWATLPENGVLIAGPDYVNEDGSIEWKAPWFRSKGKLEITGHRVDNPGIPPFEAYLPEGYGDSGVQSVGWHFPTEGCWEITGKVGDSTLTFTELVLKSPATP